MRTAEINRSLERTISAPRLAKYLATTGGDLDAAIGLYERNTRLSEALYTTMQGLEVCLRNSIDFEMCNHYGEDWMTNGNAALERPQTDAISQAIRYIGEFDPPQDDVVAELKFSFWVSLLGRSYDNSIWRTALHKSFSANGSKSRRTVHQRMNALRRFRNRVAHHEPIFNSALQMHSEAIEAIGWMCTNTQSWISSCSRFTDVHNA